MCHAADQLLSSTVIFCWVTALELIASLSGLPTIRIKSAVTR